jgi:uncharacterized protein
MNGVTVSQRIVDSNGTLPDDEPPSPRRKRNQLTPAWREAVREQMVRATHAELVGRHGDLDVSFNYRWEHVKAVVTLANRLAALTGADAETVEAAAWLHDVCKWTHGEDHPVAGAAFARAFLPTTDFPPQKIDAVAEAIAVHQGLYRDQPIQELTAQVLWDADKLAKIGLTAVFHWTGGALAGDEIRTMDDLIARGRDAEWQARTVASMHTAPARRAAKKRLAAYNALWDTLESELAGADLEKGAEEE